MMYQTWYHWLGREAADAAREQETREQLLRELPVRDDTDADE